MRTNTRFTRFSKAIILAYIMSSLLFTIVACTSSQEPPSEVIPSRQTGEIRFAFGSCNHFTESESSEIFTKILEQKVDAFAWLGDAAYIDKRVFIHKWQPDSSVDSIKRKFNRVKSDPYYDALTRSPARIIGVWDDHDYNMNDGDKHFEGKHQIQQLYLDFLDEPDSSPRRSSKSGIYTSYFLGENKLVKVILLVASGTQIIPDDRLLQEKWFLESRRRLMALVKENSAPVLLLSGDIHSGEIMQMPCSEQYLGYTLREVTSSGLSFTNSELTTLFPFFKEAIKIGVPPTFSSHELDRYLERNYGMINVIWDKDDVMSSKVQLHVYGNRTISTPVLAQEYELRHFHIDATLLKEEIDCPIYERTGGQRLATNFIQLLKEYDPVAMLLTFIATIVFRSILTIVKTLLSSCLGGYVKSGIKQKTE